MITPKQLYYWFLFKFKKRPEHIGYLTQEISFEKESNGRWYVVLPDWSGPHESLVMVAGADTLLEFLSHGKKFITLNVTNDYHTHEVWKRRETTYEAKHLGRGDYYIESMNWSLWLCGVAEWLFGKYPDFIYFTIKQIK